MTVRIFRRLPSAVASITRSSAHTSCATVATRLWQPLPASPSRRRLDGPLRHLQALLAPQALHALTAHAPPLPLRQGRDAPVPEARILSRQLVQAPHQLHVQSRPERLVTLARARLAQHPASDCAPYPLWIVFFLAPELLLVAKEPSLLQDGERL